MATKITSDNISFATLTVLGSAVPKVSTITYPGDDTATDTAGGQTITLTGSGFAVGATVIVNGTSADVVTFISSSSISFTAPAQSAGTYVIYVINTDGGTALVIPGLSYSGTPSWSTAAGSLGTGYETASISSTVTAAGDAPITYSLFSGTLPTGSTLNTSSGLISGTAPAAASSTTYNFVIRSTDGQNQDTNRAFSLTISPDVVTWNSPADGYSTPLFSNTAMATFTMSATSAAGKSITYTANSLPTGLSISGATIIGTPTVVGSSGSLITATAADSARTATRTFNWVVSVASDTYWPYTTLLLNGETTVTPFIKDASVNNFGLTIQGDTKPTPFDPYTPGYYSNYFDGTGDYLAINYAAGSTIAGDFTWEAWAYDTGATTNGTLLGWRTGSWTGFIIQRNNSANVVVAINNGSNITQTSGTYLINAWNHVAVVRSGTTVTLYVNGTSAGTVTVSGSFNPGTSYWIGSDPLNNVSGVQLQGYISNQRFVNGTAVYTSNFTPSATPLTAITNTSLLTCQSNGLIDSSTNAFVITKNGHVSVSPNIPFTANSSYSTYGSTYFDGSDSLSMAGNAAYAFGTGDFTIEFWLYMNVDWTSLANQGIAGQLNGVSAGWQIYRNTGSNDMMLRLVNTSDYGAGTYPATKVWEHWAVTRSGTTLRWFKNGAVTSTATGVNNNVTDTAAIFYIGYTQTWGGYLDGTISDLRIVKGTAVYTTTFTPPTSPLTAIANTSLLTLQYNGGATNKGIIDNSNFNNIITRFGNTSQGSFSPYSVTGWSNYFNGSTDYLSLPTAAFSSIDGVNTSYTLECWVYPQSYGGAEGSKLIAIDTSGQTSATFFLIAQNGSFGITNAGASNYTPVLSSAGVVPLNTWSHLCLSKSGSTARLFFNGILQTTVTVTAATMPTFTTTTIGARFSSGIGVSQALTGYISNMRLVVGTAIYTSAFTPPTSPLTPLTTANTRILTCQSDRFIDNGSTNYTITPAGTTAVQAFSPFGSIGEATPQSYSVFQPADGSQINVTYSSPLLVGTGQFTIEAWIYVNATRAVQQFIFSNRTYNNIGTGTYTLYIGTTNLLTFDQVQTPTTLATSNVPITIGAWQHVAVSRDINNLIRLFINGVLVNTPAASTFNFSSTNNPQIGWNADTSNNVLIGSISNLRFIVGSALYTTGFTPPTGPLTAIANTVLLTCQSTTITNNSNNALTITTSGDVRTRTFNPFGYTTQSTTNYTPILHGGSAYFDGTGDYVSTPAINWSTYGSYTFEFWIYHSSFTQSTQAYASTGNTGFTNFYCYGSTGNNPGAVAVGIAGTNEVRTPNNTITGFGWYHITYTYDGTTTNIFVNGIKQTTTVAGSAAVYSNNSANFIIGSGLGGNATFGYMSDVRLTRGTPIYSNSFVPPAQRLGNYSTSVPASLLLNFNNGGITDQHGSNVLETVGNAQLSTAVKKYNNASMYFDGTGDYLTATPNFNFGTGNITMECWIYANTLSGSVFGICGTHGAVTDSKTLLYVYGTGSIAVGKIGANEIASATGVVTTGTWYHVAAVRNGSTTTIYINGTSVATNTTAVWDTGTSPFNVAYMHPSNGSYWNGYIDDLRVTKDIARYTGNFTAPTDAFITK
jgi:hypothetical protein